MKGAYIKSQKVSLMFHFYRRDTSGKQSKYQNQDKLSYETEMCSFVRGQKVTLTFSLGKFAGF
jgi:hypothetical protein